MIDYVEGDTNEEVSGRAVHVIARFSNKCHILLQEYIAAEVFINKFVASDGMRGVNSFLGA